MCSSSVTELSLSHAGLRQDYKRWTAMCSKSSYLPSLEGMPCKIWLAMCSMPAIDFWRPFLWVLGAALSGHIARHLLIPAHAWPPASSPPLPPRLSGDQPGAGKTGPVALVARALYRAYGWLVVCRRGWLKPSRPGTVITADGGSVAFNI